MSEKYELCLKVNSSKSKNKTNNYVVGFVDNSIGNYYRRVVEWLFWTKLSSPLYSYHVTIINGKYDIVPNINRCFQLRCQYSGSFYSISNNKGKRFILPIHDTYGELSNFRKNFGLTPTTGSIPWHMTIGYIAN